MSMLSVSSIPVYGLSCWTFLLWSRCVEHVAISILWTVEIWLHKTWLKTAWFEYGLWQFYCQH